MSITYRKVVLKDAASIARLAKQLGYQSSVSNIRLRLSALLNNADHCVFVAVDQNQPIAWIHGVLCYRVETDSFVEIGGLVVDSNYRKRGVGEELVELVAKWSSESKKCTNLKVRSNINREESHPFYEKIGFNLNKTQKVYDKSLC